MLSLTAIILTLQLDFPKLTAFKDKLFFLTDVPQTTNSWYLSKFFTHWKLESNGSKGSLMCHSFKQPPSKSQPFALSYTQCQWCMWWQNTDNKWFKKWWGIMVVMAFCLCFLHILTFKSSSPQGCESKHVINNSW